MKTIKANAICLECGSTKENAKNGMCINGHDNWLELEDSVDRFEKAEFRFRVGLCDIKNAITSGVDLMVR